MFRLIIIAVMLMSLTVPALATDDRGIAVRPVDPTGETVKGEQWLLTIGIDTYLSWPRLKTAVNDAKALKNILMERYTFDKDHVIELYDENATRRNILGALRDLTKKIKPDDSLLIFYAGHGHIDNITKKGSWIPVESSTDDPSAWIGNQDIKDYLNIDAIKAKHILLVSDSCFSGDFFRGQRGALPEVTDKVIKKAYQLSSRQAITSGGLEPVSDAGFGGNSIFSHFLVTALKNNTNPYLIPSELFPAVKSGVAQNAEQFPQMGSLYGVGGQEGGELVLFLKQENRLQGLSTVSQSRQKELEQLRKVEQEAEVAKQKEQAEIAKRERELAALDKQIAEMNNRLGTSSARSSDSLDSMLAMVERKEEQARHLETLRQQREDEENKRQQEINRLKKEALNKRAAQIKIELGKYEKIVGSPYGKDMKTAAWSALVTGYPEAKEVTEGDVKGFLAMLGLARYKGAIITLEEEDNNKREEPFIDDHTGLMWAKHGNIANKAMGWSEAINWVKNLNYYGHRDWRLPTKDEFEAFVKRDGNRTSEWFNANGFNSVQSSGYWSDSAYPKYSSLAWGIDMKSGIINPFNISEYYYVWPVREITQQLRQDNRYFSSDKSTVIKIDTDVPGKLILNKGTSFNHDTHHSLDCKKCHDGKPGNIPGFGKDYAHKNCKGCHQDMRKGPTSCKDCHR